MDVRMLKPMPSTEPQLAAENRARLRGAGVFTVNVIGGMGSGKTSLIRRTLESRLTPQRAGETPRKPPAASNCSA